MMNPQSKSVKIAYWSTTGLFAALMGLSAVSYFANPALKAAFAHVGFPDYFRIELGAAKALGAIALLSPLPRWLKEWAYAGFFITLVSAFIAHANVDGLQGATFAPLVILALAATSYVFFRKRIA